MMIPWLPQASDNVGCGTHMRSPAFAPNRACAVCSVIQRRACSLLSGAQKNSVRLLWSRAHGLVRSQDSAHSRSVVRGYASVFGVRGAPRTLSELRQSEARAPRVSGRQPLLHQALCLLCGAPLPPIEYPGCGQGTQLGLAHGQRVGQAVHARAARARRYTRPQSHWHRRDLDSQAPHLSHRGQRLDPWAPDLVWWPRPLGGQHA